MLPSLKFLVGVILSFLVVIVLSLCYQVIKPHIDRYLRKRRLLCCRENGGLSLLITENINDPLRMEVAYKVSGIEKTTSYFLGLYMHNGFIAVDLLRELDKYGEYQKIDGDYIFSPIYSRSEVAKRYLTLTPLYKGCFRFRVPPLSQYRNHNNLRRHLSNEILDHLATIQFTSEKLSPSKSKPDY